jgi:hypothetical protein
MKSRFAMDMCMTSRFPKSQRFIYIRTRSLARRFACTRIGVVNPPLTPLAAGFTAAMHQAWRRLSAHFSGPLKGGL